MTSKVSVETQVREELLHSKVNLIIYTVQDQDGKNINISFNILNTLLTEILVYKS